MKKIILMTAIGVFFLGSIVQATMIEIVHTDYVSNSIYLYGNIINTPAASFWIDVGDFNYTPLLRPDTRFNTLIKLDHNYTCNDLIDMLQRTYTPHLINGVYDTANDDNMMYASNSINGWYSIGGQVDYLARDRFFLTSIPDLSAYNVNDLYLYLNIYQDDLNIYSKLQIYADAQPVPEPATILMVTTGLFGAIGCAKYHQLRAKGRDN